MTQTAPDTRQPDTAAVRHSMIFVNVAPSGFEAPRIACRSHSSVSVSSILPDFPLPRGDAMALF